MTTASGSKRTVKPVEDFFKKPKKKRIVDLTKDQDAGLEAPDDSYLE